MANKIEFKILADTKSLEKQLGKTKKSFISLEKVGKIALGGLVIGIGLATKAAIDFEDAFAGVRKTVDATEKEFKQLSKNLISLAKRIPVTAVELANIQEIAGQLGIRGVKNLTKFTESIAKIAVTTNLTKEEAATSFARIASVIGEPIENIDKMASAIVALGNQFPVTESEVLTFAQRIAGMGKVAKLTTSEIFGISAAFASVGIQAELGGTAINKVLLELTTQGKTGAKEFTKFVNKLVEGSDNIGATLEELGLKSTRSQQAFISLAGAGGKLEKSLKISNTEFEKATALNIEAEKKFATTAQRIKLLISNFTLLGTSIGNSFLPIINSLIETMGILNGEFDRLRNSFKKSLVSESDPALTNLRLRLVELQEVREKLRKLRKVGILGEEGFNKRMNDLLIQERRTREAIIDRMSRQKEILEETQALIPEEGDDEEKIDPFEAKQQKLLEHQAFLSGLDNQELISLAEKLANKEKLEKTFEQKKTSLLKKEIENRQKFEKKDQEIRKAITQQSFALISSVVTAIAGESKAAAIALKAIRIAEIIINGQAAKALIQATIPPPFQPPLLFKQNISTALQVATVAATSFAVGTGSVPNDMTANIHRGETIIPSTFAESIRSGELSLSGGEGGGGGITIDLSNATINGITDEVVEDIFTKASENLANGTLIARGLT